jgi:effector-binding domain-containing protein
MGYIIDTREVIEQPVLSIRERFAGPQIPEFIGGSFAKLYEHAGRSGIVTSAPPFVLYHSFDKIEIDAEASVPTVGLAEPAGPIGARVLPAATVAHTLHVGPYDDLTIAYEAVQTWITEQGLEIAGPFLERYLTEPDVPPEQCRTEIEVPVVPVQVPVAV